jgi:hypothetical protein
MPVQVAALQRRKETYRAATGMDFALFSGHDFLHYINSA